MELISMTLGAAQGLLLEVLYARGLASGARRFSRGRERWRQQIEARHLSAYRALDSLATFGRRVALFQPLVDRLNRDATSCSQLRNAAREVGGPLNR